MSVTGTSLTEPDDLLQELGWTRRLAFSLVGGDVAEAEEVVQETCLAALRAHPAGGNSLRPWLRQVAMNLVRGRARGARRRLAREQREADRAAVSTPEELMQRAELHRLLVGLVLELDEARRVTVLQRYFEGRSAVDIAARTGTPAATVRWRLKSALVELRARLAERYAKEEGGWRRALLPLAEMWGERPANPPGGGPGLRVPVVAAFGVLFACASVMLLVLGAGGRPPATTNAGPVSVSGQPPNGSRRDGQARSSLANCLAAIEAAQPRLAELRRQRHQLVRPSRLFKEGAPNPRAWLELDRIVRRIIAGDDPVFPQYQFECRTWACQLVLEEEDRRGTPNAPPPPPRLNLALLAKTKVDPMEVFRRFEPGWSIRIQTNAEFRARSRGLERPPGVPSSAHRGHRVSLPRADQGCRGMDTSTPRAHHPRAGHAVGPSSTRRHQQEGTSTLARTRRG